MRLRTEQRATQAQIEQRVLAYLYKYHARGLANASTLGAAAWPDNNMKAQGLAFAIGPTLRRLQDRGWIRYATVQKPVQEWGYKLTPLGRQQVTDGN